MDVTCLNVRATSEPLRAQRFKPIRLGFDALPQVEHNAGSLRLAGAPSNPSHECLIALPLLRLHASSNRSNAEMRRGGSKAATVLQLNKELRTARSVNDLGSIVEERLLEFDGRHVAICIYGLATLDTRLDAGKWSVGRVGRKLVPQLTKELESEGLGHRSLSNICWAVAKLSSAAPELESLSVSLALAGDRA
eukprot:s699_g1.t2